MRHVFALILLTIPTWFVIGSETNETDATVFPLSQDFIKCMEKGKCGIESLCNFRFRKYHLSKSNDFTNTDKDTQARDPCNDDGKPFQPPPARSNVPVTPGSTVKDLCVPIAEGFIFSVSNAMDYPVTFQWNVLDKILDVGLGELTTKKSGTVTVPANGIRYFTDSIYKTHTVRLFVRNEFVDEALAMEAKKCTVDDTCDLLFNMCYQNQESQLDKLESKDQIDTDDDEADLYMCKIYKKECGGFSKRKSDREKDLETYLRTRFPSYFMGDPKNHPKFDSESTMECLIDSPTYKEFKSTNGNFIGAKWRDDDSLSASAIVGIVFFSIFLLVMIVILICFVKYCKPTFWSNYITATNETKEEMTNANKIGNAAGKSVQKNATRSLVSGLFG